MRAAMKWVIAVVAVLALLTEIGVRLLGFVDFPIYEANNKIGYIPAANQKGSFLNSNDWEFNSFHMGATEFSPSASVKDILLIGDSIVLGGNPVKKLDKLGPRLEQSLSETGVAAKVWPISAGSWALLNELEWIRENPTVLTSVDEVVFVLNSADFGTASSWTCQTTHPLSNPKFATCYLFNKYVYALDACGTNAPSSLLVKPRNLQEDLASYIVLYGAKTRFILYPSRDESASPSLRDKNLSAGALLLSSMQAKYYWFDAKEWKADSTYYRDDIHPTTYGNKVIATFIAKAITTDTRPTNGGEYE